MAYFVIFYDFLSVEHQHTATDGYFINFTQVKSGVPQGSVLGPPPFIFYASDMWYGISRHIMAYADANSLLCPIPNPQSRSAVATQLKVDFDLIFSWCQSWGTKLNSS